MALVRIAGSALGSVNKNLEGGKIDNAISATFACDNVTSALLLAGPSAALSIMFVFSRIELTQLWSVKSLFKDLELLGVLYSHGTRWPPRYEAAVYCQDILFGVFDAFRLKLT